MAHVIDGHNVRPGSSIENRWFPKAFGHWRVQGGAVASLSWNGHQRGWCRLSNESAPTEDAGTKYCRDSGLVQIRLSPAGDKRMVCDWSAIDGFSQGSVGG